MFRVLVFRIVKLSRHDTKVSNLLCPITNLSTSSSTTFGTGTSSASVRLFSAKSTSSKCYDVFIVGGGVVGSTIVHLLLRDTGRQGLAAPLTIGILDSRRPKPLSTYSLSPKAVDLSTPFARSYALSPASLSTLGLEEDGVIDKVRKLGRVSNYDKMQIWESNGPGSLLFTSQDLSTHPDQSITCQNILGSILEDPVLVSSIWDTLQSTTATATATTGGHTVDFIAPATVSNIATPPLGNFSNRESSTTANNNQLVQLSYHHLQDEDARSNSNPSTTIHTKLLIAADGADSFVRKSLHMPMMEMGYGRTAVISTVQLATSTTTAFQRFFPSGPLALLPLWNNFANVIWSTTPNHAKHLMSIPYEQFTQEVNDAMQVGPTNSPGLFYSEETHSTRSTLSKSILNSVEMMARTLGEGLAVSNWMQDPFRLPPTLLPLNQLPQPPARFAIHLTLSQAKNYVSHRVALVGDAAHRLHPMAGLGLNLGIADAACLVKLIQQAQLSGMDVGDAYFLQQYDKERKPAVLATMAGIQLLHTAFSTEYTPALWLRSIGVNIVNSATPLRQKLANIAAGNSF